MTLFQKLFTFLALTSLSFVPIAGQAQSTILPEGFVDNINISCINYSADRYSCDLTVSGWAVDRTDTSRSIDVHLYVDNTYVSQTNASLPRPDVNSVLGIGNNHGFSITANYSNNIANGFDRSRVKVYGIGIANKGNPELTNNAQLTASSSQDFGMIKLRSLAANYNWGTRQFDVNPNENGTQTFVTTCGDVSGVLTDTCNKALTIANGRQLFADKSVFSISVPNGQDPVAFGRANGIMNATASMKAYRVHQIIYSFCTDYSQGCSSNKFSYIFFDALGNQYDCGISNGGVCNTLQNNPNLWIREALF